MNMKVYKDEMELCKVEEEDTLPTIKNRRYDVSSSVIHADFEFYIDDNSSHRPIMLSYLTVSRILIMDTKL